ncbi:NrfD/PsrC family molybdoenzyme membrane anchor subunit [Halarcobacter ebronensis]|uniref:Molybdopterin oxidoreductase n=1 Tax=Halarcobacter ebronensis TaxID=1462615 RepID=A0A4Q1B0R2_9BACT|nr:NrfD/PsrC family molybdoenzyme membrane anchor subunit [Halarcobacter ebronensis]QKF80823.1 putative thiosulfate/polysulfide reductase, membrane-anchoring subunit [Halarcobacter ebronensis]RXK08613.1 molybdopterin oxidoreductase [Halarcobacter ebronensis]
MNFKSIIPIKEVSIKELFSFKMSFSNVTMAMITLGLVALFTAGAITYFIEGHHAYNVTREHPWGLIIGMYVFFVVSSTGLCIMSSIGHVFGVKEFEIIGKRAILGAILTICTGFLVIALEIGHPVRMVIYNILTPGFTSAIWWMGTLYGLYLCFIIFEFIFLIRNDHKWSKIFGLGGLLVGIAAHSNLGAVFGFLIARPIANGVFFPIYFILSAMITGSYLLFLMYGFRYKMNFPKEVEDMLVKLAKILGLLLAILMFFEIWRMLTSIYGGVPGRAEIAKHILMSPNFLVGEVLLGMLIPFIIILVSKGKNIKGLVWASILGMVGIFFMRYDLVHDTQLMPLQLLKIREYQLPPSLVEYFPSFAEIAISIGGIGVCLLVYYFAEKFFNLDYDK